MKLLLLALVSLVLVFGEEVKEDDTRTHAEKAADAIDEITDEVMDEKNFTGTRKAAKAEAKKRIKQLNHLKELRAQLLKCQVPDLPPVEDPVGDRDEATYEGDLKLDPAAAAELIKETKAQIEEECGGKGNKTVSSEKRSIRNFALYSGAKWDPVIYYDASKLPVGGENLKCVEWSFAEYHKHMPCLSFVSVPSCAGKSNCMQFTLLDGQQNSCWGNSPVGRRDDNHNINLSECWHHEMACSVAIHEIGHSFGLPHTQTRPDRDNYVVINWANMDPDKRDNFVKQAVDNVNSYNLGYDFDSMMHYESKTFSAEGGIVIKTLDPSKQDVIGKRVGLSPGDIALLNKAYCSGEELKIKCILDGQTYDQGKSLIAGDWVKTCMVRGGQSGFYYNGCADSGNMYFDGDVYKSSAGSFWKCAAKDGYLSKKPNSCSFGFVGEPMNHIKAGYVMKISSYAVWCTETSNGVSRSYMSGGDSTIQAKIVQLQGQGFKVQT